VSFGPAHPQEPFLERSPLLHYCQHFLALLSFLGLHGLLAPNLLPLPPHLQSLLLPKVLQAIPRVLLLYPHKVISTHLSCQLLLSEDFLKLFDNYFKSMTLPGTQCQFYLLLARAHQVLLQESGTSIISTMFSIVCFDILEAN